MTDWVKLKKQAEALQRDLGGLRPSSETWEDFLSVQVTRFQLGAIGS